MTGVAILVEALSKGGKVEWDPQDGPHLRVPRGWAIRFQGEEEVIREVLRRAVIFRSQIDGDGPFKLFILPEGKDSDAGCISCGEGLDSDNFRCPLCQTAAWIALGITPLSQTIPQG